MSEAKPLSLRLLGEIAVFRGGHPLNLPASRKARALLAYLAATGEAHRRGRLCALLWDAPDDPRGALRSSLSKLRTLVDEPGCARIVTDGDTVRFDGAGVSVDLETVRRVLAAGPARTADLEASAALFRGDFIEGLMPANCPDFDAWCAAEREEARRMHVQILQALIERYAASPEAALPHARTLARIDPDAIFAHLTLLRTLMALGRKREAEEQLGLSRRILGEISERAAHELTFAWRELAAAEGERPPVAAGEGGAKPVVLVLPFANMSGDPEQEQLSDGLADDIITDLSGLPALDVVARNTAFSFKHRAVEMAELRSELGVSHVLEGGVRKSGDRIRVTAQLVCAATGSPLWAERFDHVSHDLFGLQDDVSRRIVDALKLIVLADEPAEPGGRPSSNAQAARHYQEGRAILMVSWSDAERLRSARRQFAAAVKLDPGFARAYAGLADCDAFMWVNGDLEVAFEDVLANSSKALDLAPNLTEAQASRGIALYIAGQPESALITLRRALELDPESFEAHFFYGLACRDCGRLEEAAVHYQRAADLEERNHQPLTMLADVYAAMGLHDQSITAGRSSLQRIERNFGREPEIAEVLGMGAATLVLLGDHERADRWIRRALLLDPESYSVRYNAACAYAVIGRPDLAMEQLEYAYARVPRARGWLARIAKHDAQLDSLRGRGDFQQLMRRLEAGNAAPESPCGASGESHDSDGQAPPLR